MDCCNYPEYRPQYGWGETYGGGGGGGYTPGYAPLASGHYGYSPYATYGEYGAHEHYARHAAAAAACRYSDYSTHLHQADRDPQRALFDYGGSGAGYMSREPRVRRAGARRDTERTRTRTPAGHHLPLSHTPTPPLDCGSMVNRVPAGYCDPHLTWSQYQMGGGGWSAGGGGWGGHRDPLRHLAAMHDHCALRNRKVHTGPALDRLEATESRTTSFSYDECGYGPRVTDNPRPRSLAPEYVDYTTAPAPYRHEKIKEERPRPPRTPPAPAPAPATVPLPAFQQAFGSTEIGRFAEAFTRAEAAHDDIAAGEAAAAGDLFPEWEPPAPDATWQPHAARALKCENSY